MMENQTNSLNATVIATTLNSTLSTILPAKLESSSSYNTKTILLVVALCFIMLVGIVGNSLVIHYFGWKLRGGRSIPDRLFLYLGIVDLLSSIINPATFLYFELTRYKRWDFGVLGCKILVPFGPISTLLSSLLIQIITIDRFIIFVKPFGRTYGIGCINVSVLLAIGLAVTSYTYYIYMLQVPVGKTCIIEDVTDKRYSIPAVTFILLQDVTFISIIVITNIAISFRLAQKDAVTTSETGTDRSMKRRKKLIRMLLIMAVVFLTLILPKDLFQLSFTFSWMTGDGIKYNYELIQLNTVLKILYVANSSANVFIYSKMHSRFYGSLRDLICKSTPNIRYVKPEYKETDIKLKSFRRLDSASSGTKSSKLSSTSPKD